MVDFNKHINTKFVKKKTDPVDIYNDLDRSSETGPLRPSQELILNKWYKDSKNKSQIVKLHTGEGKTLIGLLLLQSKINSENEPCVYVCPNIYLAQQVMSEAKKFGVPYCYIGSDRELPEEFLNGTRILITHVQKMFNGETKFLLDNKSIDVNTVILDDSHACIDSIKKSFTISVKSSHGLYKDIFELFHDSLKEQGEGSFLEIENSEYNTMLPIPYWSWIDKASEVTRLILKYKTDLDIRFAWPLIKDSINKCQAYISGSYLEISPAYMPISRFGSFYNAKQQVLMSATTQDDGFFIKGLGFSIDSVTSPLVNEELKWSGEKMLLMPSLVDDGLDRETILKALAKPLEKKFGIISLTPDFKSKKFYTKIGAKVATSTSIFEDVKSLKSGDLKKCVVFANRYDGIDLPDNTCRVLIIDSKPYFDSLLNRYEEECRTNSDIINIQIAQKIEQGLGRSVRGQKDYSAIVLLGGDLVKFMKSPSTNKYFSNQTKQQISIGLKVCQYAKDDISEEDPPLKIVTGLLSQSINRDEGWKNFYTSEMDKLGEHSSSNNIYEKLELERKAEELYFSNQLEESCTVMQRLIDEYPEERYWYLQLLAKYTYGISKVDSNSLQISAFKKNRNLLKPKDGIEYSKIAFVNEKRTKRIREWIKKFDSYSELKISLDGTLDNFSFGMDSEKFEQALDECGKALGFVCQRPDKEIKKGPDNLWCGKNNQFILLECKNEVELKRKSINKKEAGQMNTHTGWFQETYGDASCKRILIIPTYKVSYYANFTHDVEIMTYKLLNKFKSNIVSFFKEFKKFEIHEISDEKIQELINYYNLDLASIMSKYSRPPVDEKKT